MPIWKNCGTDFQNFDFKMLAKFLNIKFALTLGWLTKQPKLCYNPVAPAYLVWAHYAHGRQRSRCQEDPVGIPSGRLEKITGSSPHHVAQHRPTGSEATSPYAPQSSRFGSEPPSVEHDVDIWRYRIVSCMPETTTMTLNYGHETALYCPTRCVSGSQHGRRLVIYMTRYSADMLHQLVSQNVNMAT